jgi:hypothetical protein
VADERLDDDRSDRGDQGDEREPPTENERRSEEEEERGNERARTRYLTAPDSSLGERAERDREQRVERERMPPETAHAPTVTGCIWSGIARA